MERPGEIQFVVPIHNEGENVAILHRRLCAEGIPFDSLRFVYDVEDDSSLPFLREIERADPRVRAERNELGRGVVNALRWGFAHSRPGPVIVLMGDNSDKLSIIPEMLRLWREGATVVCPSRYTKGGRQHGGGLLKSSLSRLAGRSLGMCGFPTSDPTNNFKLYDADWLQRQTIESKGGFEIALELCYKAFVQSETIRELPTEWWDRDVGTSRFRIAAWLPHYLHWYVRALGALLRAALR